MKTSELKFGTIYLGNHPSGKVEPFRYLGWCGYMRKPYDRFGGAHCGVWILRGNEIGQTDSLQMASASWFSRQVKGLQKQINNRQNKLDIYNNILTLVS